LITASDHEPRDLKIPATNLLQSIIQSGHISFVTRPLLSRFLVLQDRLREFVVSSVSSAIFYSEMDSVLSATDEGVSISKKKKRLCDHCDRLVSKRAFNAHKRRKKVHHDANTGKCEVLLTHMLHCYFNKA